METSKNASLLHEVGAHEYFEKHSALNSTTPVKTIPKHSLTSNEELISSKIKQKIEFPEPLLLLNDVGIVYPNTITMIQGKSGVHKSRLSSHMMSSLLSGDILEIAKIKRRNRDKFDIVCIDTERSINDLLPYAMQSVITDAGFSQTNKPSYFRITSVVNIERKSRLEEIKTYIREIVDKTTCHTVIFLDVVSDLIEDFNNVSSSLQLLDYLNSMINEFNITIVAIIHENPGSMDKSRGHLGTELHNKASSVIQISGEKGKDNRSINIQKVTILKARYTASPEPIYFSYNPISKKLEEQDSEYALSFVGKKTEVKAPLDEIFEFFKTLEPGEKIKKQDLIQKLCAQFNCSDKLLSQRIDEIQASNDFFGYTLQSEMVGRVKFYWLESQTSLIMEEGK